MFFILIILIKYTVFTYLYVKVAYEREMAIVRELKLNKRSKRLLGLGLICLSVFILFIGIIYSFESRVDESLIELRFDNEEKIILDEYDERQLNIFVTPKYAEKLNYFIEDNEIAIVNDYGQIKALKSGNTKIIVTVDGTKKEIFKEIIVNKIIKPERITFENIKNSMVLGESIFLKVKVDPEKAVYKSITYKSSDNNVLSITPKGVIKACGIGKGKITATIDGTEIEQSYEINVNKEYNKLRSIHFQEGKSGYIESGNKMQLHAELVPENIKNTDIVFSSNNTSIASIDNKGIITAHRPGEVTIVATSQENKNICAKYELQVKKTTGYLSNELLNRIGGSEATKLMVVAHPDDDILWGGGHLSEGGWLVICLTNEYNDKRNAEFNHAMDVVNAKRLIMAYPDLVNHRRNNWSSCKTGIQKDIDLLMKYKKWDQIVTHNPDGEYGHIHHKMVSQVMTKSSHNNGTFASLSYFGHFYSNVPSSQEKMSDSIIEQKQIALNCYTTQLKAIERNWKQMVPYENWVKASQW